MTSSQRDQDFKNILPHIALNICKKNENHPRALQCIGILNFQAPICDTSFLLDHFVQCLSSSRCSFCAVATKMHHFVPIESIHGYSCSIYLDLVEKSAIHVGKLYVRDIANMGYHCKLTIIYTSNQPSSCSMKSTTKFIHI